MVAADHSQTLLASVLRVMLHALNTNQVPYSRSFLICWKKSLDAHGPFLIHWKRVFLMLMVIFQSTNFLQHLFAVQRSLVSKWVLVHLLILSTVWSWMQNPWETFNANINKIEVQTYIILQNEGIPTCSLMKPQSTARRFASVFWNTALPQ